MGELPGGETFVLADYLVLVKATDGALPPPLTLNDGTVIEGAEVLAALGEVNLDLVGDPAAGGQAVPNATGNASYTVYFPEGLGDYLLHGPFAPDPSAFGAYDQLDDLVGQRTLGTADIEVLTSIKISGYEDAQPNQHLGDDTLDLMKAEITMVPSNEATYRISLTLNDIPDGALLYVGGTTPADIVTVAGGSYTVDLSGLSTTDQEALLDSVYMIAPPDSDIDFTLSAVAVFGGPTGDLDVPVETLVIVDAVAEQADLLDQNDATAFSYTYNEDQHWMTLLLVMLRPHPGQPAKQAGATILRMETTTSMPSPFMASGFRRRLPMWIRGGLPPPPATTGVRNTLLKSPSIQ